MTTIGERIRAERESRQWTQEDLAKRAGIRQSFIGALETGMQQSSGYLPEIAHALEVDAHWLKTGLGNHGKCRAEELAAEYTVGRPDSIAVSVFDAEGSMGLGKAQPENDTVIGALQLSPTWVRQHLPAISSPANLAVLTAYGDSMEPTFQDGDMLLVDRGVLEVKLDAVYVLAHNNQLFIKRIQRRMNGDVVIKSDNTLYDPHVIENGERESIQVLGRVVWAWNGRKL